MSKVDYDTIIGGIGDPVAAETTIEYDGAAHVVGGTAKWMARDAIIQLAAAGNSGDESAMLAIIRIDADALVLPMVVASDRPLDVAIESALRARLQESPAAVEVRLACNYELFRPVMMALSEIGANWPVDADKLRSSLEERYRSERQCSKPEIKHAEYPVLADDVAAKMMAASVASPSSIRDFVKAIVMREHLMTPHLDAIEQYYIGVARNIQAYREVLVGATKIEK